ncbi:hypothetical protein BJX66DRAFT_349881 [Aspergillus keveii]|uniref:Kelch repeat protein n=1 Tax=Aspergillus keveii TaxID=714993 RepID=A0ABR4FIM7_9EURO
MSRLIWFSILCMSLQSTARAGSIVAKRDVLSDLSGGFCQSWKFGATIANEVLYMIGLHGGQMPGDDNSTNNYLVELDLSGPVDLSDGANYNLSLISSDVPSLKDQALWPNRRNTTLYSYGGRGESNASADEGAWTYTLGNEEWELQSGSVKPVRLSYGAHVNVPDLQAAYWVGGYQSHNTTPSFTDDTKEYTTVMLQFNTTTGEFSQLDAPFTPVQEGALVYIPNRRLGTLIYFGGEVPSEQSGTDATLTPNAWDYVQIYDLEEETWYNQTTTGDVTSRTQFCAAVVNDPDSWSYQIFVIGGADFESENIVTEISYLSIPSFKWYTAKGLTEERMSLTCEVFGRQIFGIGGRLAWDDGADADCYDAAAFIYDAQTEAVTDQFDPSLPVYSIPSALAEDIRATPTPSQWSDSGLAFLYYAPLPTSTYYSTADDSPNKGAIAGGTVGGVAGVTIIVAAAWFFWRARRRKAQEKDDTAELGVDQKTYSELPTKAAVSELPTRENERSELTGDIHHVHELDSRAVPPPVKRKSGEGNETASTE